MHGMQYTHRKAPQATLHLYCCRPGISRTLSVYRHAAGSRAHPQPCCKRCLAVSFNTLEQLQFLPRFACTAVRADSTLAASAAWDSEADKQTAEQQLEWSLGEQEVCMPTVQPRSTGPAIGQEKKQQQQQQQQHRNMAVSRPGKQQLVKQQALRKQQTPAGEQQQRRTGEGDGARSASAAAGTAAAAPAPPPAHGLRPHTSTKKPHHMYSQQRQQQQQKQQQQRRRQPTGAADDYEEAQQRVRQLLVSADVNDPQAAADALADTVNDIVIALQVLATAAKPTSLSAIKQYEAATQQMAAALVAKFKRLLLSQEQHLGQQQQQQYMMLPQQQQQQQLAGPQQQQQQHGLSQMASSDSVGHGISGVNGGQPVVPAAAPAEPHCLAAALAMLTPTKLAATTFSLGALRHYDTQLVPALAEAALHVMVRSSSSSGTSVAGAAAVATRPGEKAKASTRLGDQQQRQRQQHVMQQRNAPVFNANQLGQLAQGFVYLDQPLRPDWQAAYLQACQQQLRYMRGPQLASLAVFLVRYREYGKGSAGSTGAVPAPVSLDIGWLEAFLLAAAQQASSFKPQQLVQVLQAVAGLYQEHLQQQQQQGGRSSRSKRDGWVFQSLPMDMADVWLAGNSKQAVARQLKAGTAGSSKSSSSSSTSRAWLLPLLVAFQQQLPDWKMHNLAAGLLALAQLTVAPWPQDVVQPLLLQLRLLLPAASGPDVVAAAAALAQLSPPGYVSSDAEFSDALLQRLHAVVPTLGPSGLAGAVSTLAVLQVKPYKAWLYELFARLRVEAQFMAGHEVVAVIEGLAVLRVQLDPEVLHMFVLGIKRCMGLLGSEELRRLVAGLRLMYPRVLPGRTVAQLVEELQRRAAMLELL